MDTPGAADVTAADGDARVVRNKFLAACRNILNYLDPFLLDFFNTMHFMHEKWILLLDVVWLAERWYDPAESTEFSWWFCIFLSVTPLLERC